MNLDPLREVIDLLKEHKLGEIDVEEDGMRIKVVAAPVPGAAPAFPFVQMGGQAIDPGTVPAAGGESAGTPAEPEGPELNDENTIPSPIVGTFYRAPSPDNDKYVEVGDDFDEESVLCIVEAMKVMNEIKAERTGKIVEVLVENGQPVEFGQPLFRIEPRG